MNIRRLLYEHRDYLVIYLTPLILMPLPLVVNDPKGRCGYMLLLMGTYWCTDSLPLAVTGLIPVFMAPMFRLLTVVQVCSSYLEDNTMMLTGGLFVAVALEKSELHRRLALFILKTVGTQPSWLMFGFMLPTWILSMWISNTATTSMMLPILEAVLEQLQHMKEFQEMDQSTGDEQQVSPLSEKISAVPSGSKGEINLATFNKIAPVENDVSPAEGKIAPVENDISPTEGNINPAYDNKEEAAEDAVHHTIEDGHIQENGEVQISDDTGNESSTSVEPDVIPQRPTSKAFDDLCKGMTMAVAYSANVGGTATLTGTSPNTIMKGHADDIWRDNGLGESPVTYATWIIYGFPQSCINFILVYLWMRFFYLGWRSFQCGHKQDPEKAAAVKEVILSEYRKLGKIRYAEAAVGILFIILVLLWFFRSPGFIQGWGDLFGTDPAGSKYIGDAVPAVLIAVIMFCVPMFIPKKTTFNETGKAPALLDWDSVHEKFPWSIIFLIGGGFALADACETSGLSEWIGEQFAVLGNLPGWLMVAIICLITAFLTEVTSNSATCTILMPIVAAMAEELGQNPLYLMMPTAISTSFAFMLPVATPPNAIAFSYGRITVMDMVKAGAILNFLCVFTVTLATHTWGYAFFDYGTIPWEDTYNVTTPTL